MDLAGDEIQQILHSGGVWEGDVLVDRYVIVLHSGRCVELDSSGVRIADATGLTADPAFADCIGARIESVVVSEEWATPGLRLSNCEVLVMGAPRPYYWGLEGRSWPSSH
jgi:hypothetical protein